MKSLIARCVVGAIFLSATMAAAFDPPFDRCNDVPDTALRSCLKPIMDEISARHQPGERSIFSDIMSKKPVPSDNVVPPSSEAMTPYEQRRVEEQAAKTLYEDRVAQRAIEDLKYQRLHEEQRAQERQYREQDREDRREAARMQALGMFLGSRPFSFQQPMPTYQPAPPIQYEPPTYQAPAPRAPVNCTSNRVGDYTYTNCN